MSQSFMTITVRRRAQWDLYALDLGCRGVHTGITRGLSRVAGGKHLDKLARACVTRRRVGLGERRRFRRPCLLHVYTVQPGGMHNEIPLGRITSALYSND